MLNEPKSPSPARDFAADNEEDYCRLLVVLQAAHPQGGLTGREIADRFGKIDPTELDWFLGLALARGHIKTTRSDFPDYDAFRCSITAKGRDWVTDNAGRWATPARSVFDKVSEAVGNVIPPATPAPWSKRLGMLMFALKGEDGLDRFREALAVANIDDPADIVKIEWETVPVTEFMVAPGALGEEPAYAVARVWYMERVQRTAAPAAAPSKIDMLAGVLGGMARFPDGAKVAIWALRPYLKLSDEGILESLAFCEKLGLVRREGDYAVMTPAGWVHARQNGHCERT